MHPLLLLLIGACSPPPQADDSSRAGLGHASSALHDGWPVGALALTRARLVDASGARQATVVLLGDRIYSIEDPEVHIPRGIARIDLHDRWLVPGLIDPHVHLFHSGVPWWVGDALEANLRSSLYWGVTSVVDAASPVQVWELRDRIEAGDILAPSVKGTGPMVTEVLSHPCELWNDPDGCWFATEEAAGRAHGEELVAAGSDGIKVAIADASFTPWPTPRLDPAVAAAAIAPVLGAGGFAYAHVDEVDDALDALDAGATHLAHPVFGGVMSPSEAALVSAAPYQHTTISALRGLPDLLDGSLPLARLRPTLEPAVAEAWRAVRLDPSLVDPLWAAQTVSWAEDARSNLESLAAEGAVLLPASDAGYWYVPHGWGLHVELQELVELGYSPTEALVAATDTAARSVGWENRGRIEAGYRADLLVLRSDPTLSVEALRRIDQVILGGELLEPEELVGEDLLRHPAGAAEGEFCLEAEDCATGDCDLAEHQCAADCATPYDYVGACDAESWCAPVDLVESTADAVCHIVDQACDLYDPAGSCSPAAYGENCVPADVDTSYCYPSGPQGPDQACSYADPAFACQQGLFCSWISGICSPLCDPELGELQPAVCGADRCITQHADAGVPWFGLCL